MDRSVALYLLGMHIASSGGIMMVGERLSHLGKRDEGGQAMSDQNKAMLHRLVEAINRGDMNVVDELFTPELAEQAKQGLLRSAQLFPTGARR